MLTSISNRNTTTIIELHLGPKTTGKHVVFLPSLLEAKMRIPFDKTPTRISIAAACHRREAGELASSTGESISVSPRLEKSAAMAH
jgi:hypothetical protein